MLKKYEARKNYAADFMHYAQTRIATIDVYIVMFIILMYYFMYRYYETSFYDTKVEKTWFMLLGSGICMGLEYAEDLFIVHLRCGIKGHADLCWMVSVVGYNFCPAKITYIFKPSFYTFKIF